MTAAELAFPVAWVGHACLWTYALNNLYGRPIRKSLLKRVRLLCGAAILGFPALLLVADSWPAWGYLALCLGVGGVLFPLTTLARLTRRRPAALLHETTETVDYWAKLGRAALGDGRLSWVPRLPGSDVFRVDFTTLTLAPLRLPPAWDGLTLLVLSDLHFHGTPSRAFFDAVIDDLLARPTPDLVLLVGDYLDTDTHHDWIVPLLGRLQAKEGRYAILGNHDAHHDPERVRSELAGAGYTVLRESSVLTRVRGIPCAFLGHEGPWFPAPDGYGRLPPGTFKICLSHSPDNFRWGQANFVDLMLCGHVHGGQIRLPVVGPIFVPSVYSRRYDGGVYAANGTTMVVGRGLSGKEPLRYNCRPQVLRVVLTSPVRPSI